MGVYKYCRIYKVTIVVKYIVWDMLAQSILLYEFSKIENAFMHIIKTIAWLSVVWIGMTSYWATGWAHPLIDFAVLF